MLLLLAAFAHGGVVKLRSAVYDNAMLLGTPRCTDAASPRGGGVLLNSTAGACGAGATTTPQSVRWDGALAAACGRPGESVLVSVRASAAIRLWVRGFKLVERWGGSAGATLLPGRWNFTWDAGIAAGPGYSLRVEHMAASPQRRVVQLLWAWGGGTEVPVPDSCMVAEVRSAELRRQSMQAAMARGWNTWSRRLATAQVHLPTGFGFDVRVVDPRTNASTGSGAVDRCVERGGVAKPPGTDCAVRPGPHAYNGSYTRLDQRLLPGSEGGPAVRFESAHLDASGDTVVLLLSALASPAGRLVAVATPSFFFDCVTTPGACGTIAAADGAIVAHAAGFGTVSVRVAGAASSAAGALRAPFDAHGRACLIAALDGSPHPLPATVEDCAAAVARRAAARDGDLTPVYGPVGTDRRDAVEAIRSVVGWNTMFDSRIKVVTPVSRNFGAPPPPGSAFVPLADAPACR